MYWVVLCYYIVFLFCGFLCATNRVDSAGWKPPFSSLNTNQGSLTPSSTPPWLSSTVPRPSVAATCFSNEFRCRDGSCVRSDYRCDRISDCKDQSDESDCGGKYDAPLSLLETRVSLFLGGLSRASLLVYNIVYRTFMHK